MTDHLLTLAEVADICRVTGKTIRAWARLGKFPAPVRAGKFARWRASEVQRWMEQLKRDEQQEAA